MDDGPLAGTSRSDAEDGEDAVAVEIHPTVAAAFRALDDAAVAWVLLRGVDDLAHPSGDVDVLVEPGSADRVDRALAAAGLHRLGVLGHGRHRFYFSWDPAERLWIGLDVVPAIDFGRFQHLRTPLAAGCLGRRRRVRGLWRLAERDEAWLFLLHLLLDKRRLDPSRREAARSAAHRVDATDPVGRYLEHRVGVGAAQDVVEIGRRADGREFSASASALIRRWTRREPLRVPAAWLATLAARALDLPFPGHPAGLVVAVTGPDGAPTRRLVQTLRTTFPGPRRVARSGLAARVHRRLGRLVLLDGGSRPGFRPDLVLALGPPEALRSPEGPASVVLDATRSAGEVADDATSAIWARLIRSMAPRGADQA